MADKDKQDHQGKHKPHEQPVPAIILEQQQQAIQNPFAFMGKEEAIQNPFAPMGDDVGYGPEPEHGWENRGKKI